jgi:hypothetical protein
MRKQEAVGTVICTSLLSPEWTQVTIGARADGVNTPRLAVRNRLAIDEMRSQGVVIRRYA